MREVLQQTEKLTETIKRSSAYNQYQILYQEMKQDESLFQRLNAYRRSKFLIQMTEQEDLLGRMEKLEQEYADILSKESVKGFLSAEFRYCRMMRLVKESLLKTVDLDLDFLED